MKDRVTAALLAIFLGGLGVHKFYIGKTQSGIIYLIFCWTGIPTIIGFIEGIIYLTQTDKEFHIQQGIAHVVYNESSNNIGGSVGAADEIRKYKDLYEEGVITQSQFEKKKNELLGVISSDGEGDMKDGRLNPVLKILIWIFVGSALVLIIISFFAALIWGNA